MAGASAGRPVAFGSQPSFAAAQTQGGMTLESLPRIEPGQSTLEESDDEPETKKSQPAGELTAAPVVAPAMQGVEVASGSQPSAIPDPGPQSAPPILAPSFDPLTSGETEALLKFVRDTEKEVGRTERKRVGSYLCDHPAGLGFGGNLCG